MKTQKRRYYGGNEYWNKYPVSGTELYAMRLMRKKSLYEMSQMIREPVWLLRDYEQNVDVVPPYIARKYMKHLGITPSHMAQFKKIIKGELKQFTESRTIASSVKRKVREKCNNQCVKCGSNENLHFHHLEKYSHGGQNTIENLVLLCARCHAEEHKDDPYYHLLKNAAEKAGVSGL